MSTRMEGSMHRQMWLLAAVACLLAGVASGSKSIKIPCVQDGDAGCLGDQGHGVEQGPRRMLQQAANAPAPSTSQWTHADLCSDHPPPGKYGCDEQRDFDKCFADFMVAGDFCRRTCGRCQGNCNDVRPPGEYTCAQQKQFDKCDEHYIRDWGYCAATCERCDMQVANEKPQDAPAASNTSAVGSPTASGTAPATWGDATPQAAAPQQAAPAAAGQAANPTPSPAPVAASPNSQAPVAATPAPKAAPVPAPPTAAQKEAAAAAAAAAAIADAHKNADENAKQQATPKPAPAKHAEPHHDSDGDDAPAQPSGAAHSAGGHEEHDDNDDMHTTVNEQGQTVVTAHHSIYEYVHGILMATAFGILIPVGVFTSRYGKFWSGWFQTHRAVQTIGWAVAAAGFVLALIMHKLEDWSEAHEEAEHAGRRLLHAGHEHGAHDAAWQARHKIYLIHKYVGIAIFLAITLQASSLFCRPDKKARLRGTWAWAHWLVGWAVLAVALFNCWEGIVLLQPLDRWYSIGYWLLVAAIVGWAMVAEVRRCVYGHELEGYKQAGENGDLEMVGGSREERQGLTGSGGLHNRDYANGDAEDPSYGGQYDLEDDDEELAMVTAKYAKD